MINLKKTFLGICLAGMSYAYANTNFNKNNLLGLLNTLSVKADLSNKTKKENAGYLLVFTRQDLDRMKIQNLGELFNLIPFLYFSLSW